MGMGVSGRAAVAFLLAQGAEVFVTDSRAFEKLSDTDQEYLLGEKIAFECGGHTLQFMAQGDFIVISPGVPTDLPILSKLHGLRIPIFGELALAAPYLTECVVAVTGTNGKTTVTALIGELLRASGKKVFVGGNIGTPILDYLRVGERVDVLVLELSSFQLESAGMFSPHVGVLLNVTPDHLDRHKSMALYTAAKMKMFAHQHSDDIAIVCADDPICEQQVKPILTEQRVCCFGTQNSNCPTKGGEHTFDITIDDRTDSYSLKDTVLDSHTGLLNGQAAVLAVSHLGCKKSAIEQGLKSFELARHRLQYVRSLNGVQFFNDSKATNTGAVLSSLASFSGNIILIAGGRDKGENYGLLKQLVSEKVKALVLIGEAADAIGMELEGIAVHRKALSMQDAVGKAAEMSCPGDTVLLAPACASFDMFDSYVQRGDVFMDAVFALEDTSGEMAA